MLTLRDQESPWLTDETVRLREKAARRAAFSRPPRDGARRALVWVGRRKMSPQPVPLAR